LEIAAGFGVVWDDCLWLYLSWWCKNKFLFWMTARWWVGGGSLTGGGWGHFWAWGLNTVFLFCFCFFDRPGFFGGKILFLGGGGKKKGAVWGPILNKKKEWGGKKNVRQEVSAKGL